MNRPWVLITGCSTGIGRALVAQARAQGWGVVATARSLEVLEGLQAGEDLKGLALDVTRADSIAAAVEACGGLRLVALINNAGYGQMGPLELLTPEELRAQFETNVVGLHAMTRACLPLIRRNAAPGEGRIIHIASVLGRMSIPLAGAYNASKHAVVALAETLRLEVSPGIRVILVEPGAIQSQFRQTLARAWGDLPQRVQGTPFEAMVARYIAREQARAGTLHGLSAQVCAARIARALASQRPPRRLSIGSDALLGTLGKALLPAGLWEWAVKKAFGL